jgi:6-phosphogluconolactonase
MNNVRIFDDRAALAEAAAKQTVKILQETIEQKGSATWVLAGGSTPLAAYEIIAEKYHDSLDWTRVTVLIGDERIGATDGPDNNWHAVDQIIGSLPTRKLRPQSDQSAEDAANNYQEQISSLPLTSAGLPCLDLVWLGVGADGHTLSLFPSHPSLLPTSQLVISVHDSPKPPPDRISLSLRALIGAQAVMIIASGKDKQAAISTAITGGSSPIALAASIIKTHDGRVTWLVDKSAAPTD